MASPLKSIGSFLFGSPSQGQQLPMFMLPQQTQPQTPPPVQSPQGNPNTYKRPGIGQQSFLSSAAPPPTQNMGGGGKSLLGQ